MGSMEVYKVRFCREYIGRPIIYTNTNTSYGQAFLTVFQNRWCR